VQFAITTVCFKPH